MLSSWKFAANAVWEKALTIDASLPVDLDAVEKWILANPQNVAFESIFSNNDKPDTMFGIRMTYLPKTEQVSRMRDLLSLTGQIAMEADFRREASRVFPELDLFSGQLEAMNIGIVGQWYSFGPEAIWSSGQEYLLTIDDLKDKAPRFFEPMGNPAAIEFWYTAPVDHWYKIYVSDLQEGEYRLNAEKYAVAIARKKDFDRD